MCVYVCAGVWLQRHGYCTLGEAFNRLDFSSAIQDVRRFNYVVRVRRSASFVTPFVRVALSLAR